MSPPHSRQSSTSSVGVNNPAMSPTSPNPSRRLSKHIIPTQKASYGHVKSKVGSFDNIGYVSNSVGRGRASSRASSADDESQVAISNNGRSRSPSAMSSTSSSTTSPTSPTSRRSSFKIPPSKKVDYSNVRSKVGSLEHVHHTPQGGNLRVFSEKLHFREQAQSKIAKEINIVQFYQNSDQSFDGSATQDQEGEQESEHYNQSSIISSSEDSVEDFEPPKNILAVVEEVIESIAELDIEQEPQANGSQDVHLESGVAL
ncbi:hypothetical protein BGX28_001449 [Mortierella sp. GBA30]|nr:hypothetical protein BGX28_001449 [Mortierella sp. GBA30]